MTGPKFKVTPEPGVKRAYRISGRSFRFTQDQRQKLRAVLNGKGPQAEDFLSKIEWRVHMYLVACAIARIEPQPTPSKVRKRIARLYGVAARLHDLLQEADLVGEISHLRCVQFTLERRIGAPEALEKSLKAFLPIAAAACAAPNPGGRLPNRKEFDLILGLAHSYHHHFGKLPPTSRDASFSQFVGHLLDMIGPDDAPESGDRYRLIRRAVENIRTTPAQTALLKTPPKKVRL